MQKLTVEAILLMSALVFLPIQLLFASEKSLETKLMDSVRDNNLNTVQRLIGLGADPFASNLDGVEAV